MKKVIVGSCFLMLMMGASSQAFCQAFSRNLSRSIVKSVSRTGGSLAGRVYKDQVSLARDLHRTLPQLGILSTGPAVGKRVLVYPVPQTGIKYQPAGRALKVLTPTQHFVIYNLTTKEGQIVDMSQRELYKPVAQPANQKVYTSQEELAQDLNKQFGAEGVMSVGPDGNDVVIYAIPEQGVLYQPAGTVVHLFPQTHFVIYDDATGAGQIVDMRLRSFYKDIKNPASHWATDAEMQELMGE